MHARVIKEVPGTVLREMVDRLNASSVEIECLRPGLTPTCWVRASAAFSGYLSSYTTISVDGFTLKGHYAAYQRLHGLIRDPYIVLDHLCWTPACWNPDHMEPVTQAVNNARRAPYLDGRYRHMGDRQILRFRVEPRVVQS